MQYFNQTLTLVLVHFHLFKWHEIDQYLQLHSHQNVILFPFLLVSSQNSIVPFTYVEFGLSQKI
jgi:hypothetical protein